MIDITLPHTPVFFQTSKFPPIISLKFKHYVYSFYVTFSLLHNTETFLSHQVDGRILVEINEAFARDVLFITHALKRRKLLSLIERLKKVKKKKVEVFLMFLFLFIIILFCVI